MIKITKNTNPKEMPKADDVCFGKHFADHMFIMDYTPADGWHDARIVPYENLSISPSSIVFHYGQEMFEGMKAYRTPKGIALFRPEENIKRFNNSCGRMCMPPVDVDFVVGAIKDLVKLDENWVPSYPNTSLYIRPFIIATDCSIDVRPSNNFKFLVICSPSCPMYGLNPSKIYVEDEYVRAVKGGLGFTKAGANYVAAMRAQNVAHEQGFDQVLWLDGIEHKYVEEVGAMNIFFVIGDEIITPSLSGSILAGITRMSTLELLTKRGYKVSEQRISINKIVEAHKNGELKEVFGTGTAAVVSPVGVIRYGGKDMVIGDGNIGKITKEVYDTLVGIQFGEIKDEFGWMQTL